MQVLSVEARTMLEYLPATQLVQTLDATAEYVPASQSVQTIDATDEYVPASQLMHAQCQCLPRQLCIRGGAPWPLN
jgi:hypothetical protein